MVDSFHINITEKKDQFINIKMIFYVNELLFFLLLFFSVILVVCVQLETKKNSWVWRGMLECIVMTMLCTLIPFFCGHP